MDKDLQSTELGIFFEFAETEDNVLSEDDVKFVKSVLENHELYYDHYEKYNIITELFVGTDENIEEIDQIESKIQTYFDEFVTERDIVDDEIYGSEPGTYQTWIRITEPAPDDDDREGGKQSHTQNDSEVDLDDMHSERQFDTRNDFEVDLDNVHPDDVKRTADDEFIHESTGIILKESQINWDLE